MASLTAPWRLKCISSLVLTGLDLLGRVPMGFGGGEQADYGKPSFVLKGLERSGTGEGFKPDGEKYKYDVGKVEGMVKAIAKEHGWGFKKSINKP